MVRHIILWQLKEGLTCNEKTEILENAKINLEGLNGKITGLTEIKVVTEKLPSSNADMMLDGIFESETALKNYSVNPLHMAVADKYVRPYIKIRSCIDFKI